MKAINDWEALGEKRGRHLGQVELVIDLLASRLGRLPAAFRHQIESLDSARLRELNLAAPSIESKDGLRQWLKAAV